MKKIFAILLSALALGGCENDGIPYVSLGLDDLYKVARMQTVDLKPAFTGESYRWTVKTGSRFAALGREGLHLPDAIPGHL